MIEAGSRVFLRGCPYGEPGHVLRIQGKRITVLWGDLNYLAHHRLETLMEAPCDRAKQVAEQLCSEKGNTR